MPKFALLRQEGQNPSTRSTRYIVRLCIAVLGAVNLRVLRYGGGCKVVIEVNCDDRIHGGRSGIRDMFIQSAIPAANPTNLPCNTRYRESRHCQRTIGIKCVHAAE